MILCKCWHDVLHLHAPIGMDIYFSLKMLVHTRGMHSGTLRIFVSFGRPGVYDFNYNMLHLLADTEVP